MIFRSNRLAESVALGAAAQPRTDEDKRAVAAHITRVVERLVGTMPHQSDRERQRRLRQIESHLRQIAKGQIRP